MNILQLVFAYLRHRPWLTLLNVLLLALGLATLTVMLLFAHQAEERLRRDSKGVDLVIGAKGTCGDTVPSNRIPERREAPEHFFQSARAKGRHVFDDDPRWVRLFDEAQVLEPESGLVSSEPFTSPCDG